MEELLELKQLLQVGKVDAALLLVDELEEISRSDKINKIDSYGVILLIHLIKQTAEGRSTRSWTVSIQNAVREIQKLNKRRNAGGYFLTELYSPLLKNGLLDLRLHQRYDEAIHFTRAGSLLV
jgi:ABC-type transporter Mla MlaB component